MNNRYTFKAKRKDNGEWVYGNVIINPNSTDKIVIVESGVTSYSSTKEAILEFINDYVEVIPETIYQCTGLQDRDGNYIFENDIIDIKNVNERIDKLEKQNKEKQDKLDKIEELCDIAIKNSYTYISAHHSGILMNAHEVKEIIKGEDK